MLLKRIIAPHNVNKAFWFKCLIKCFPPRPLLQRRSIYLSICNALSSTKNKILQIYFAFHPLFPKFENHFYH